jgi:hypothetical protein
MRTKNKPNAAALERLLRFYMTRFEDEALAPHVLRLIADADERLGSRPVAHEEAENFLAHQEARRA